VTVVSRYPVDSAGTDASCPKADAVPVFRSILKPSSFVEVSVHVRLSWAAWATPKSVMMAAIATTLTQLC
jgi:hypothetical protein